MIVQKTEKGRAYIECQPNYTGKGPKIGINAATSETEFIRSFKLISHFFILVINCYL